ncbi:MAG: hypothetical protein FJ044_05760 [Candidatus Cloacimonetes bacterium]|nr:hypothetical protein [Candidatus Cloacimonadota bacterium]
MPIKTFFWRDYQGREVDLILSKAEKLIPIEITNSESISRKKIDNLGYFLAENKEASFGLVVYGGELKIIKSQPKPIFCLPWWLWW